MKYRRGSRGRKNIHIYMQNQIDGLNKLKDWS